MSETRHNDFERRMNNWRLWRLSERASVCRTISQVYRLMPKPPRGENIMPILAGEAAETDQAVHTLPATLRRAIEVWYLMDGTMSAKRRILGCRRERMLELLAQARAAIEKLVYGRKRSLEV